MVTGTRAEFGLLATVMRAVRLHPRLELLTVVTGAHLVGAGETWRDVDETFGIDARVEMQRDGAIGRAEDAKALGRGIEGLAIAYESVKPDWVVVLGDRIEALAAACAASVSGIPVAHLHGGDRAEGVADEAMRHAITKLAHLHLPATAQSADRIIRMGEDPARVIVVGSPAIDGLGAIEPMSDEAYNRLGNPRIVFLMHPIGRDSTDERRDATAALEGASGRSLVALLPNLDPGREGIVEALRDVGAPTLAHLRREQWIGLLKRVAIEGGVLLGNSSAGLIEASALRPYPLPAVDIGPRQSGRECPETVIHVDPDSHRPIRDAIRKAEGLSQSWRQSEALPGHPYGEGLAGERTAAALAELPLSEALRLIRKRNTY
ncbi:MAG: UDP-N-acetylglucosamine 2-epimerase [Phycisphaerales bacterium]